MLAAGPGRWSSPRLTSSTIMLALQEQTSKLKVKLPAACLRETWVGGCTKIITHLYTLLIFLLSCKNKIAPDYSDLMGGTKDSGVSPVCKGDGDSTKQSRWAATLFSLTWA